MNCYNVKLYVIEGSKNSDRIEQNWWAYSEEEAIGKAVMEYKSKHKSGNFMIKDFMVDQILNEGEKKSMRIVIGKETAEITEQDVRCMQLAIMRDFDMKTYQLKNFTLKQWIDAILSHFAKMLNEKTGKKVEIDVELLNELDRLIDTIGITYDLWNKRGHEIISIVKSEIEKAEREEGPAKENGFKMSPEGVKFILDGRIDQLEKRVEAISKNVSSILKTLYP